MNGNNQILFKASSFKRKTKDFFVTFSISGQEWGLLNNNNKNNNDF